MVVYWFVLSPSHHHGIEGHTQAGQPTMLPASLHIHYGEGSKLCFIRFLLKLSLIAIFYLLIEKWEMASHGLSNNGSFVSREMSCQKKKIQVSLNISTALILETWGCFIEQAQSCQPTFFIKTLKERKRERANRGIQEKKCVLLDAIKEKGLWIQIDYVCSTTKFSC